MHKNSRKRITFTSAKRRAIEVDFNGGAESISELTVRAEKGDSSAQDGLGMWYGMLYADNGSEKDGAESVKWYRKAAEQGSRHAQNTLGFLYAHGHIVPKDSAAAAKWYIMAAEQGYGEAQKAIGLAYWTGDGVLKDNIKAARWIRAAAEQGYYLAMPYLGLFYATGVGVPKDIILAHVWYNLSGAYESYGTKRVKEELASLEREMTSDEKAEATRLARELFAKLPTK